MADLFDIDGESGGATPWEWTSVTNEGSSTFALDAAAACHGTAGYRATSDGTATNEAYGRIDFTASAHTYVRGYFKLSSDAVTSAGAKIFLLSLWVGGTYVFYIAAEGSSVDPYPPYRWYINLDGTIDADTTTFSLNAWHYIEMHHYNHAVDGGAEVSVDSTQLTTTLGAGNERVLTRCHAGAYNRNLTVGTIDVDSVKGQTTGPIGPVACGTIVPQVFSFYQRLRSI